MNFKKINLEKEHFEQGWHQTNRSFDGHSEELFGTEFLISMELNSVFSTLKMSVADALDKALDTYYNIVLQKDSGDFVINEQVQFTVEIQGEQFELSATFLGLLDEERYESLMGEKDDPFVFIIDGNKSTKTTKKGY